MDTEMESRLETFEKNPSNGQPVIETFLLYSVRATKGE